MISYNALVENYNALDNKCHKAVERVNNLLAEKGCLEIELAGLREELKNAYREISELHQQR